MSRRDGRGELGIKIIRFGLHAGLSGRTWGEALTALIDLRANVTADTDEPILGEGKAGCFDSAADQKYKKRQYKCQLNEHSTFTKIKTVHS